MNVIVPIAITASMVTSNVAATTTPAAWNSATSYTYGDEARRDFNGMSYIFRWIGPSTIVNIDPAMKHVYREQDIVVDEGKYKYGWWWLVIGAVNEMAMFSNRSRTPTVNASEITVTITPGEMFNTVALLNIDADEVQITVSDPDVGLVYDSDLLDLTGIIDFYEWYFYPTSNNTNVIQQFLPPYPYASVTISATSSTGNVSIGEIVVGITKEIGKMLYGSTAGIVDYSEVITDDQGASIYVEGKYAKKNNYSINVDTDRINDIVSGLAALRATPAVYIGVDGKDEWTVYGFYSDFSITGSGPVKSSCKLEITELS